MSSRDLIGKRGENIAVERLMDFCGNPLPYFDPHPLGEKCPTYDFLVELVGTGGSNPYFLAQVKSTRKSGTKGTADLKVQVKAKDVQPMVRCPIPTYLIGIDEPAAKAYIVSVHGILKGTISSIPTSYPLDAVNLRILRDEVRAHWQILSQSSNSKSSAFTL
jgi:hypothetical protein